jgi:hypothetical protein
MVRQEDRRQVGLNKLRRQEAESGMLKRPWLIVLISSFALLGTWIGFCDLFCPTGTVFEFKCRYFVRIDMTMEEAESVLGKAGKECGAPESRVGALISGDKCFVWRGSADLYVGVRNGRICSKWVRVPSL